MLIFANLYSIAIWLPIAAAFDNTILAYLTANVICPILRIRNAYVSWALCNAQWCRWPHDAMLIILFSGFLFRWQTVDGMGKPPEHDPFGSVDGSNRKIKKYIEGTPNGILNGTVVHCTPAAKINRTQRRAGENDTQPTAIDGGDASNANETQFQLHHCALIACYYECNGMTRCCCWCCCCCSHRIVLVSAFERAPAVELAHKLLPCPSSSATHLFITIVARCWRRWADWRTGRLKCVWWACITTSHNYHDHHDHYDHHHHHREHHRQNHIDMTTSS